MEISNLSDAEFKTHVYQDTQRNHWILKQHKKDPDRNEVCIK